MSTIGRITTEPVFEPQKIKKIIGGLLRTVGNYRAELSSARYTQRSKKSRWRFFEFISKISRLIMTAIGKVIGTEYVVTSSAIWFQHQIFADFLRHSIEDNSVDTSSKEFKVALDALDELRRAPMSAFALSVKPARALKAFIDSVQAPRSDPEYTELVLQPIGLRIRGRVPGASQSLLPVSNTLAKFVPVLDENLADASLVEPLVAEYLKRIKRLSAKHGINALCFIQKDIGPVGALAMLSTLVAATGLPACVYRLTHWSRPAMITGYKPKEGDNLLVVYDFVVTGSGITQPAKELQRITKGVVKAAVVAFGYGQQMTRLHVAGDQFIELDTIGWYSDCLSQIEQFSRESFASSSSVTGEAFKASPVLGALASPPMSEEENMTLSEKIEKASTSPASGSSVPSIERIEAALASLEARGVDVDQLELEDLRKRWSKHPLRDVLEPTGFDFED